MRVQELTAAFTERYPIDLQESYDNSGEQVSFHDQPVDRVLVSLDVVDAQLALSRTRVQRLQAAYDFDAALAEFLEACGMSSRFEDYRSYAEQEVRR